MNDLTTFEAYCPKRISYIIPTKNRAEQLDKALARCREFVEPEDELIVVDGSSSDHTREVVKKYVDMVSIFISEPDKDSVHALNKGILIARGKYIKAISDDDIYHPQGMKQAAEVLEKYPEIDLLICGGTKEKNGRTSYFYIPAGVDYGKSIEDVFRYGRCGVGHFFRRKALANAGLHPPMAFYPNSHEWLIHPDAEYLLKFIESGAKVKFCRINAFHHPYSHDDAVMKTEKYWLNAAKRYCSRTFYLKYLFSRKLRWRKIVKMIKYFRKMVQGKKLYMYHKVGGNFTASPQLTDKYIWDGGLS